MVSVYCDINVKEAATLQSGSSPIVILNAKKFKFVISRCFTWSRFIGVYAALYSSA